jgi:hypothetical protein
MNTVFISYRRENTAGEARALFNDLVARLGENSVFMDVDSIALGRDFRTVVQETTASCDLMLVLIGRNWADAKDEGGRVRLENPADYVRLEIESALKRDIAVTPVLVQGAHMPAPEDLPADIRDLAYRNGFELSHNRWESDVGEMVRRLDLNSSTAGDQVKPIALQESAQPSGSLDISTAPVIPQAKPPQGLLWRRVRLTRRQGLGVAALAVVGTGAAIAAPSIRKLLSRPTLRTISFDAASVDEKGLRKTPEKILGCNVCRSARLGRGARYGLDPRGQLQNGLAGGRAGTADKRRAAAQRHARFAFYGRLAGHSRAVGRSGVGAS